MISPIRLTTFEKNSGRSLKFAAEGEREPSDGHQSATDIEPKRIGADGNGKTFFERAIGFSSRIATQLRISGLGPPQAHVSLDRQASLWDEAKAPGQHVDPVEVASKHRVDPEFNRFLRQFAGDVFVNLEAGIVFVQKEGQSASRDSLYQPFFLAGEAGSWLASQLMNERFNGSRSDYSAHFEGGLSVRRKEDGLEVTDSDGATVILSKVTEAEAKTTPELG